MNDATTEHNIHLAYSPDSDDAFMVLAMREGLVATNGYRFSYTKGDIQELNERARQGVYDVTAISVAAYPALADSYFMMPIGASIGDEFGPAIVVSTKGPWAHHYVTEAKELRGLRIAVPGRETSAFFAATALIGDFTAVPLRFDTIADAVRRGEVDAGILIHERQLDAERWGLHKVGDLGKLWAARYQLPLPLGANAIKRSLGPKVNCDVTAVMRASIEYGLAHRHEMIERTMGDVQAGLDRQMTDRYISMYVNHRSLGMADDVRRAMMILFAAGAEHGLCPKLDLDVCFYE